jgi:hypothetical protein
VTLLGASAVGRAEEVQPDKIYGGGARLEVTDLGVAFTVPAGWRGTLPSGSEVFLLQPENDQNAFILAMGNELNRAGLASTMAAPIPLVNGLSLYPTGSVGSRGEALTGRYEVHGGATQLAGYGEALAGSHGVNVAYVLVAVPASLAAYEPSVRALIDSTDLGAPQGAATPPPTTAAGDSAGSTASAAGDRWDIYLKGKYIVYYYTASGYTDEQHLWLCSDGSFSRQGAGGGFGGGASGAFQADSSGRWTATGAGEHGTLTLSYGDGSQARHELRWDYGSNQLYVDGTRWLHGENSYCN